MTYCAWPTENFPYKPDTFLVISRMTHIIRKYSMRYDVPAIAVAGAIADEYNTQRGVKGYIDWVQNWYIGTLSSHAIEMDARIGMKSKLFNATLSDVGKGNIKLDTAKDMYRRYGHIMGKKLDDWEELVEYLLTEEGTVQFAAIVIKHAKFLFAPFLTQHPSEIKEAVYVTYYKQGDSYFYRFRDRPRTEIDRVIKPGEGCRVYFQRKQFKLALGLVLL